jgi:hypothetical protein
LYSVNARIARIQAKLTTADSHTHLRQGMTRLRFLSKQVGSYGGFTTSEAWRSPVALWANVIEIVQLRWQTSNFHSVGLCKIVGVDTPDAKANHVDRLSRSIIFARP